MGTVGANMREHVNLSWGCPRAERPARRFGPTPSREFHRNHNNAMSTSTAKGENGHVTAACAVCGENANGNFFGALVCLPCKVRVTLYSDYEYFGALL